MKTILTITALALVTSCAAQQSDTRQVSVNLGGFTKHTSERKGNKDFNEVHNNIGLQYQRKLDNKDYVFFNGEYFKDSFDNDNGLVSAGYKYCPIEGVCIPVGIGSFFNYEDNNLIPYTGVEFSLTDDVILRTAFMPPLAEEQGNKVGFGFIGFRVNAYEW